MRKKTTYPHFKAVLLVVLALLGLQGRAQTGEFQTTAWTGTDYSTINTSTRFYLFNVGTGKFITAGGDWGAQAVMVSQTHGAAMTFANSSRTIINSGVANTVYNGGDLLGVNYPNITNDAKNFADNTDCYGVILEAQCNGYNDGTKTYNPGYSRAYTFTRVEDASNTDTYTYYITEKLTKGSTSKTVYIGAKKGINILTGADDEDIDVTYVAYTAKQATQTDNPYYQWRIITAAQLEKALTDGLYTFFGGLDPNVSYLIKDPFFDRNRTIDFAAWKASGNGTSESNVKRYDWYGSATTSDNWDKAVIQKYSINDKAKGKYAYLLFDGAGTVSQTFTAPKAGTYKVQCRGIYNGSNIPYLYIKSNGTTQKVNLVEVAGLAKATTSSRSGSNATASANADGLLNLGDLLHEGEAAYTVEVELENIEKGATVEVGIGKDKATKTSWYKSVSSGGIFSSTTTSYYFDSDITAIDNFQVFYNGENDACIILDEDFKKSDYINTTNLKKNTKIYLHRTFSAGCWNSFVLPVSLTAGQVKEFFGFDTKVARLHGLSTNHGTGDDQHNTGSRDCIDFKTVNLDDITSIAIEAGQMYLINPAKSQGTIVKTYADQDGTDALVTNTVFDLGFLVVDMDEIVEPQATYGTSGEYPYGKVQYVGTYKYLEKGSGPVAGSYVFSKGDMYHLTSPMRIKGFRGWLNKPSESSAKGLIFSFDSDDDTTTDIDRAVTPAATTGSHDVYTLSGRLVRRGATTLSGLEKGIYIIGGKKVIIR